MQLSVDGFNTCVPVIVSYDSSRKICTMTSDSSTAAQELNSLPKHQVKITTSVKDYLDVSLASDCTSAGFTTASVCSSACSWSYAGASGLTAGSGHAVVHYLGKIWVIWGGNGSSVYSKVYSSSDGKHGQTLVQAEIGVHVITMQQQFLTESFGSWEAVATKPVCWMMFWFQVTAKPGGMWAVLLPGFQGITLPFSFQQQNVSAGRCWQQHYIYEWCLVLQWWKNVDSNYRQCNLAQALRTLSYGLQ